MVREGSHAPGASELSLHVTHCMLLLVVACGFSAALYSDASFSHDGADQGFLVAQFDVEHAPLFVPSEHPPGTPPSEEPAQRLNIGWNLNQCVPARDQRIDHRVAD